MAKTKINIFEYATRNKLRFTSSKGVLTVEELWQLPIDALREIFNVYNKQKKELDGEEKFIDDDVEVNKTSELDIIIDILKHIAETKSKESKAVIEAQAKAAKKQRIMELIANKQNAELEDKSIDELTKMLTEL